MNDIQDRLAAARGQQTTEKASLEQLVKKKDLGIVADESVNAMTSALEQSQQREQALMKREAQVAADLDSTKAKLAEIDTRLNELEREMVAPAASGDGKPAKRPQ